MFISLLPCHGMETPKNRSAREEIAAVIQWAERQGLSLDMSRAGGDRAGRTVACFSLTPKQGRAPNCPSRRECLAEVSNVVTAA
jgi:hypothetical protein